MSTPRSSSVKAASELKDASRDFKDALNRMRTAATEFARDTRTVYLREFDEAHDIATKSLQSIEINADAETSTAVSEAFSVTSDLKSLFQKMLKAQETLGFDETSGIQGTLKDSIYIAETSASDLSWLTKPDAQALAHLARDDAPAIRPNSCSGGTRNPARHSWPKSRISTRSSKGSSRPTS